MRTQLKSALALVMALLICVSVFAACKGEEGGDTSSLTSFISTVSVPSEAEINTDTGEVTMAYGSTYANLKEDLTEQGKLAEGETLQLFQADQVTEITDEATILEDGMIVIKKDADGNELFKLTLVIEAEVVSQVINSDGTITITQADGTQTTLKEGDDGTMSTVSVTSVAPPVAQNPSNGDNSTNTSVPSDSGSNTPASSGGSGNPSSAMSTVVDSLISIPSDLPSVDPEQKYELIVAADDTDNSIVTAIMAFQRANPNVRIRITIGDVGRVTTLDGLKMRLASGNAADVVIMDSVYMAAAGYQGYLLDLQQFGSDDVKDLFIESCWESVKSQVADQEAQFGLPFDCNTILMFYNKDLLDRAGVSQIPQNWTDFTGALELLKALPDVATPFSLLVNQKNKNYMAFQWMMYLWRMGGDLFNDTLTAAAFDGEEGTRALQMYVDMVTKYNVATDGMGGGSFTDGTIGFSMMVNNAYSTTVGSTSTNIEFGVTMLPELKAGVPRYSGLGLYSVGLPNKLTAVEKDPQKLAEATAKAKWAYEFIEFYTTTLEYQLVFGESSLLMPSLKAGEGQGVFSGDYWTIAYRQLETSKFRPGVKSWDSIESYLADAINAAVNNTKSPQEALNAAAVATNRQLA